MDVTELLTPDRIVFLKDKTKPAVLARLVKILAKAPEVEKEKELAKAISDRERILSTGMTMGIAVPHARIASVTGFVAAMGVSREGVPFDSLDGKPAHVIVMIAGPDGESERYLRILSRFTGLLKPEENRQRILQAKTAEAILAILQEPA